MRYEIVLEVFGFDEIGFELVIERQLTNSDENTLNYTDIIVVIVNFKFSEYINLLL